MRQVFSLKKLPNGIRSKNNSMYAITIQRNIKSNSIPTVALLRRWARATLMRHVAAADVTIRITNTNEMTELNQTWRNKKGPTNVLSFPLYTPTKNDVKPLLGDIILCAEVVFAEATEQNKTPEQHFAHMVVHGMLHLIGFDHENIIDAEKMEAEEILILADLGFENPYLINKK